MKLLTIFFTLLFCGISAQLLAQNDTPVHPSSIGTGVFIGVSKPLKDIPPLTESELQIIQEKASQKVLNKKLKNREYPFAETAFPKGPDAAWQRTMGETGSPKAPIVNFDGQNITLLSA